jgi:endonuclease YncB( thermonuclease family)
MEIPFDAPRFALTGKHTCRIVSLHDGDTFTGVINMGGTYWTFNIRVNGIDTPEMTSKAPDAYRARERLFQMLTGENVDTLAFKKKDFDAYFKNRYTSLIFEADGSDKYGRVLANLPHITQTLIREGLAYEYHGGTKRAAADSST